MHFLNEILAFPSKCLSLMYLGLPIPRKKKPHSLFLILSEPIDKMLAKWKGRCLSYAGRIQLVNWILLSKFQHWVQGTTLPRTVIKKVQTLAYNFSWDGRKTISWKQMALPK